MLLGLEDSSERAEWFAREVLFGAGKIRTPAERMKDFQRVTIDEVRHAARDTFDFSKLGIGIIGPFGSEQEVIKPLH